LHPPANNVIAARHVQVAAEPLALVAPGAEACAEPQVNVIRDGEVVRAIEVVCPCGQRIVLDCIY
jgi:hypothetical protein